MKWYIINCQCRNLLSIDRGGGNKQNQILHALICKGPEIQNIKYGYVREVNNFHGEPGFCDAS